MQAIVIEFLRQSAIFPAAVVAREDWLLGQEAVHNYRRLLYDLFTEANQPLPAMGVKQWSSRLTPGQRELLASLPAPAATRDSVIAAMDLTRTALRTRGPRRARVRGRRLAGRDRRCDGGVLDPPRPLTTARAALAQVMVIPPSTGRVWPVT